MRRNLETNTMQLPNLFFYLVNYSHVHQTSTHDISLSVLFEREFKFCQQIRQNMSNIQQTKIRVEI